jgi:hypothetical protein
MSQDAEVFQGNINHIIRIKDTVRRPIGYWSTSVHKLLKYIEKQGFEGAPKFLGIDDTRREILTFIPGVVPGDNYPELKPYMWSDETLVGLARLLRRYHDATQGLNSNTSERWQLSYPDASRNEVICHNDAALYNVVFQNKKPVALIDFDMAGPGPRMWDIAYCLYTSVPLASFAPDYSSGAIVTYQSALHAGERFRRIKIFLEAYGDLECNDLKNRVIERLTSLCDTLRNGVAEGNPAYQKMVDEGHLKHYEEEIKFLTEHFEDWT